MKAPSLTIGIQEEYRIIDPQIGGPDVVRAGAQA